MSKVLRYQKDVDWIKYAISCFESLNEQYRSLLRDCSDIKQQERNVETIIKNANPYIVAIAGLISQTALQELLTRSLWMKPDSYTVMDNTEPGSKEVVQAIQVIEAQTKRIHSKRSFNV